MIRFNGISKSFGKTKIIDNLSFEVNEGEFIVLIGPSGCGKTTTLKMINKLIEPDGGSINIDGTNISDVDTVTLRRKIGYVIQQIGLFPNMTVEENICIVPKLLKWDKEKCLERTKELLELVSMPYEDYAKKYPTELSGGQQQRVGVLRALAAQPPIVLMDEPFGALDPLTRDALQDEVKTLQQKLNKTIIFVTHDMEEALKMADTIIFMDKGKILQMASPEEMLRNPAGDIIREFMGKHMTQNNSQDLKAEDFMNVNVVKTTENKQTLECLEIMKRKKVNSIIVTDKENTFKGIITIEDLKNHGKVGVPIGTMLNKEAQLIHKDMGAKEAFDMLIETKRDYLVVVADDDKVIGIINKTSMVKALADALWGDLECMNL
jgi:osmoprotectant transport system ATP-binding protein